MNEINDYVSSYTINLNNTRPKSNKKEGLGNKENDKIQLSLKFNTPFLHKYNL